MKQKVRKVFLDDLPRYHKGVDWKNCIGKEVKFIYDNIEGKVKIIRYDNKNKKITVKYLDKDNFEIPTVYFLNCKLKSLLKDFKYEIGKELKDDKRDLIITDRGSRKDKRGCSYKWYKYTCNKCGWTEGWVLEHNLKNSYCCSCCSNRTAVLGINTIWDIDRWMCEKFSISEEDAKTHTRSSSKKIEVTCPDCGNKKKAIVSVLYSKKSITCSCGSKISYPEKFMVSILRELNIKFETQYCPKWCGRKFYDFYIPSMNMLIETHGIQHYEYTGRGRSLKEEQENDKLKKELALKNGIEHYIVIDCRKSEFDWMTFNVYKALKNYFDMSNIDWLKCEEFALGNLVKEVCEYWNQKEEWETSLTVAQNNPWGIKSSSTIVKYLKKGAEYGWCNYNGKEEVLRCRIQAYKNVEIFKDNVSLGVFESASELSRQSEERFGVKLDCGNICSVCLGRRKSCGGYTFRYV